VAVLRLPGAALLVAAVAMAAPATSADASVEHSVKAAFLYNFMRFVEWPASGKQGGPRAVCVVGSDPIGTALQRVLNGKSLAGRPVVVHRVEGPAGATPCEILFMPASAMPEWPRVRAELAERPVLTVGDSRGFVDEGGAVGFFTEDNHLRFEVNRGAAARSGLRLSSRLLDLAAAVDGRRAER
jgi:hypothetical protein